MGAQARVLGHDLPAVLDRGGVDDPVGGIPGEGLGQRHGGGSNGWRRTDGPDSAARLSSQAWTGIDTAILPR